MTSGFVCSPRQYPSATPKRRPAALPGVTLVAPTEANEVFVHLPLPCKRPCERPVQPSTPGTRRGFPPETRVRLVTHYATATEEVDAFLALAAQSA